MLKRVEPLRNELNTLEDDAKENRLKGDEVNKIISDLEKSISKYKEEYAVLISQAQAIKADLSAVETKVYTWIFQGSHELWKSWKTWKITKKVPCMEESCNLKKIE